MTEITSLVLGPLETNCYFLRDTETGNLVIFDPAWYEPALEQAVQKAGKGAVKGIVLTHCHFDHMMGAAQLKKLTGAPIWLPVQESGFPADPTLTLAYMVPGGLEPFEADGLLSEGKPLSFGSLSLRPIHTPGHTIGSHCFLIDDILVAGDTLFCGSVGRTDHPTGNTAMIMQSVRRLAALPGDYRVFPGHGPETTLERERRFTPYLQ